MGFPPRVIHIHIGNTAWLLPPSGGTATLALLNKKIQHLTHNETKNICCTPAQHLYSFYLLFKGPNQQTPSCLAHKQRWISSVLMYV